MIGPLSYIGGKNRLAKKIICLFPEHTTYVEPFAGAAHVFFRKEPSKVEVLNDLDGEIVNFFRVCQWHHPELLRSLQYHLTSRKWFGILSRTDPSTLTDVQKASRFLYLQKGAFAGLVVKQNYAYFLAKRPNFNPKRLPQILESVHERLRGVQLECLPYEEILRRYDRPTTLFYLDPPYWRRKLYRLNFSDDDFHLLAQRLLKVRGRFILSLNDTPEVRKLFANFRMQPVEVAYTAQMRAGRRYAELLISNFSTDVTRGVSD